MRKVSLIFISILLVAATAWGVDNGSLTQDLSRFKTELKKKNISSEERFYLNLLAGRELLTDGHYQQAREFYKAAINSKEKKDKTEAYFNLVFIEYQLESSKEEQKKVLKDLELYLENNLKDEEKKKNLLTLWDGYIKNNPQAKIKLMKGFFGEDLAREEIKKLMLAKKYKQALKGVNPDLEEANLNLQIQSDILKTLVYGRGQNLYCKKSLDMFKNSISYTMEICRYLLDGDKKRISIIKTAIREDSPQREWLLRPLGDVK